MPQILPEASDVLELEPDCLASSTGHTRRYNIGNYVSKTDLFVVIT